MSNTNRVYRLAKRPEGTPDHDTFELSEEEIPEPGPGEVLIKTLYLSVDPYMRDRMRDSESYEEPWDVGDALRGAVVGEVVESNGARFDEGDVVTGELEWAEYATAPGPVLTEVNPELAPISTALGVLGMPGLTAYFGTRDVAQPRPATRSSSPGCRGRRLRGGPARQAPGRTRRRFAGSDEKVSFLEDDLGFDEGINYKTTDDYRAALDEAAPDASTPTSTTSADRLPTRCSRDSTPTRVSPSADRSRCTTARKSRWGRAS